MIGRAYRFHGHNSLRYVYQHGSTVRSQLFAVRCAVNDRRKEFRVAVVVSKKVSKSAVVRNRIRRRLYEIVRLHKEAIVQPFDIAIIVYDERIATMPATELQAQVLRALKNGGIVQNTPITDTEHGMIEKRSVDV